MAPGYSTRYAKWHGLVENTFCCGHSAKQPIVYESFDRSAKRLLGIKPERGYRLRVKLCTRWWSEIEEKARATGVKVD